MDKGQPMLTGEPSAHRVERLSGHPVVEPNSCERAEALRLDVDLSFCAASRADLLSSPVIGSQKPLTIPPVFIDPLLHLVSKLQVVFRRASGSRVPLRDPSHLPGGRDEQRCD